MALPNVYYLTDDTSTTAGAAGMQSGGASSAVIVSEFTADTLAHAAQVAYIMSSALQRPLRLVPKFGSPPYTLITGVAATVALTSCPSGIGY